MFPTTSPQIRFRQFFKKQTVNNILRGIFQFPSFDNFVCFRHFNYIFAKSSSPDSEPDPEKVKVMKLRSEMKTRARETMDKTRDILDNAERPWNVTKL